MTGSCWLQWYEPPTVTETVCAKTNTLITDPNNWTDSHRMSWYVATHAKPYRTSYS